MTAKGRAPVNALTPAQHAEFDRYIADWQARLSLQGWRVERSAGKTKAMAEVTIAHADMLASYKVGPFGAAGTSPETIEATALHELLHVLLYELVYQRLLGLDGDTLAAAEHRVVNSLEKLLLKGRV